MIIDSKYTKKFVSDGLTRQKYDELCGFAVTLRDHRNLVSKYVNDNLLKYLEYNSQGFMKEMRALYKGVVPSSFDSQLYTDVLTSYQNKFDGIKKKLSFKAIHYVRCETYKRNTKEHKKGDFKKVKNDVKATPLAVCLTYLARYGGETTVEYIKANIETCEDNKRKYYENILRCIDKFGFDRLYSLASRRRERIVRRYSEHPVNFSSLTFRGRSRKSLIVDYNKRFGSKINAFISLSGFERKSLDIPVRYCKAYHGSMRDYKKPTSDYEYTIVFNEKYKEVAINLCKNAERYIPDAGGEIIGIDVNCKHNLFTLSDGTTYDYDRELVNEYCRFCMETDELKKDKSYKIGVRRQRKLDAMKARMLSQQRELIAQMCIRLKEQGCRHIVMEELDNGFGKSYVKDKSNNDINYNRVVKFLSLSSMKDEVEHIARKYDIAVSTVHSCYTSKMCPICGCIEDENRPNQETFDCIDCGHKSNADFNAALNIRNRVSETVFRDRLLKQTDNGAFKPRKLEREKVKEVLLSFRRSPESQGVESTLGNFV